MLVLQEWWGLVPQIKRVCDRLAGEGFVALAPDLYHGEIAEHTEMDKAAQLMTTLPIDRAARDMGGAVDYLLAQPGGARATRSASSASAWAACSRWSSRAQQGDKIGAAAPFYGAPLGDSEPDWSNLTAPVRGHFAENDDFFPPDADRARSRRSCRAWARTSSSSPPGHRARVRQRGEPARAPTTRRAAQRRGRDTIAFLHDKLR